jgi:hypothetical protein
MTSTKITVKFQQPITIGSEFSVRFSVLNPTDQQNDGFYLANTNNPTVTLPLQFTLSDGTTKYYM